jgi:uncharacterized protein (TIGR02266 family)
LTERERAKDTETAFVSSDQPPSTGSSPTPAASAPVRVRLRYAAFETFIEKFAPNVTRGGLFLASRTPRPVGDVFAFEVQLAGGEVALAGEGKVTWVREFDPAAPQKPHGMGVQFLRLEGPSREVLNQMLARKTNTTGPLRVLMPPGGSGPIRIGSNGAAAPAARPDTNVDLAAELGIDEVRLKRAVERNWLGNGRASGEADELEALLRPEPIEPVSISQALAELPRLLDPPARRMSGAFRPIGETPGGPAGASREGDPRDRR